MAVRKRLVDMEVQISVVTADMRLKNTFRRIIIRLEEDPGALPEVDWGLWEPPLPPLEVLLVQKLPRA